MRRATIALPVAVALLAGCGGAGGQRADPFCESEAGILARRADDVLRHYAAVTVYPGDMAYLMFRDGLARFERHGCAPGTLGRALSARLVPGRRAKLLSLLPRPLAETVRRAIADA